MTVYSFVTREQMADLDEDARIAFEQFASIALENLDERAARIDTSEEAEWRILNEMRFSCMNIILAAAGRFEIEPFASRDMPSLRNFNDPDWFEFRHDVDFYVTQIALDNSPRNRKGSVAMLPRTKEQIRTYISGLRRCIEEGNMDEKKREALLKKLDALEQELEKRRMNMVTVAMIAFALWQVPGDAWGSYDVVNKLLSNVMHTVAEAKADEEEIKQLPAPETTKALNAPKRGDTNDGWGQQRKGMSFEDTDGSDIPF